MTQSFNKFSALDLVGLEDFPFKEIFDDNREVWSALDNLIPFFKRHSYFIKSSVQGVFLKNESLIAIGEGCQIDPGVMIEGPCVIGEGCIIRHGAYVRGGTLLGDGALIGHATEIVRSIVLGGAKLPHFNYVGDSIIGSGVNMGAGSKCANVRLDKKEISVIYEGGRIRTGRTKFGAVVGKGASIGCNAVLNPGTILLPGAEVLPCTAVSGVIK